MPQDEFVIAGKYRRSLHTRNKYGTALRKYDPIAFEVGYHEYKLMEKIMKDHAILY